MANSSESNTFEFYGCDCILSTAKYSQDDSLAVQVIAADTKANIENNYFPGSPVAMLSLNVESDSIGQEEFAVKNYSENTGLFQSALEAGFIVDTGKTVSVGMAGLMPVAKLS